MVVDLSTYFGKNLKKGVRALPYAAKRLRLGHKNRSEAIVQYSEYDRWFRAKVEEGRKAIKEGRFITNDEAKLRASARRKRILASMGMVE